MRRWTLILAGALFASTALAGPELSKNLKAQVPQDILSQTAVVEMDVATAKSKAAEYVRQAETLRSSIKTQKLSIDTLEAQVKADKERWKVAKKAKDKAGADRIRTEMEQTETEIADAETKLSATASEADLRQAQGDFLLAAADMYAADLQYVWATALAAGNPDVDPVKFGLARQKLETAYQDARADLAEAEAAFVQKGGEAQDFGKRDLTTMLSKEGRYDTPPVSLVPDSWTNPAPVAAAVPAPAPSAPPSWTTPPAPAPAPVP